MEYECARDPILEAGFVQTCLESRFDAL